MYSFNFFFLLSRSFFKAEMISFFSIVHIHNTGFNWHFHVFNVVIMTNQSHFASVGVQVLFSLKSCVCVCERQLFKSGSLRATTESWVLLPSAGQKQKVHHPLEGAVLARQEVIGVLLRLLLEFGLDEQNVEEDREHRQETGSGHTGHHKPRHAGVCFGGDKPS